MKSTSLLPVLVMLLGAAPACEDPKSAAFGESCTTSDDCATSFCVGGETSELNTSVPFCSADCSGMATGDACGGGAGRCIADFTSWCWLPCASDDDCRAVNPERGACAITSSAGVASSFKVCVSSVAR